MGFSSSYIEIPILMLFFCFMLSELVTVNFILYRSCYITLGYNETLCALLGTSNASEEIKQIETEVQPKASLIMMSKTIIEVIVSVFCSLVVGPWSNKHGRKPILISALTGYFMCYICLLILSVLKFVSPWYYLIPCLASVLGGGICSLLTVTFCYVADITTENNRGIRMGVLEGCFTLGSLLGTLLCSYVFNYVGYLGVYSICASLVLLSIIYTIFLVSESLPVVNKTNMVKDLVDKKVIINSIKTCFKRRPNMNRAILFLLMTMLILYILVIFADGGIFFLYVREKFNWSLKQYTLYSASTSLFDIFGTVFILIVLHKWLKISDMVLVLIGFICLSVSSVIFGLATTSTMIYIGAVIKRFSCTIGPLGRSAISKIIPPDDLGDVFAFTTSLETIVQIVASPLYTLLYNNTIVTYPGVFNYLSAIIYGINVFVTSAVIIITKRYPNEELHIG